MLGGWLHRHTCFVATEAKITVCVSEQRTAFGLR
jgi:hypothetical protein